MTNLHIRAANDDDADSIRKVTLSAYQEYAEQMPPAHWELYRREILATLAEVGPAEQIVAVQDDKVVGTVLLYPAGTTLHLPNGSSLSLDWPEVRLLAVAPAARGQGIGAVLMEECVSRARQSKAAGLTLHTNEMMQAAGRMYARMGFVHAPELDFGPIEGVIVKGYRLKLNETSLET